LNGVYHSGVAATGANMATIRRRGDSGQVQFTLIEMAKLSGVNPQVWLTDTPARIADHKITKLDQRMPWRYAQP